MDNRKLNYLKKQNQNNSKDIEYDFMPGLVEIIEKPANKGGYFIIWTITLLMVISVMWAWMCKVDIVVEAPGIVEYNEADFEQGSSDSSYKVNVNINNSDIADIEMNDKVNVKIDAYAYGDYGMISGKIIHINDSAEYIENQGYVFPVEVELNKINNKDIQLKNGMTANVDICIGKRRIIEFVLEPIFDALNKSVQQK